MKSSVTSAKINGIYRMTVGTGVLRETVRKAGISWVSIDVSDVHDKGAVLEIFARELRFPDTFGGNWDALADCLQDLSWLPEKGLMVVLRGFPVFAATAPEASHKLLEILSATADFWRQRERVFMVAVDGCDDLPELPLP